MAIDTRRSCASLGICQDRVPACNGCPCNTTNPSLDAWAINVLPYTDCPVCQGDDGCRYAPEDTSTFTPIDHIYYWGSVGITVALTVCIVAGLAGFAAVKLGWLA